MTMMRGVVEAYDPAAHTVSVSLEGNAGLLADVAVLRVVHDEPLAPGDRVVVAVWPDIGAVVLGAY